MRLDGQQNISAQNRGYAAIITTLITLFVSLIVVGGFALFTLREVRTNRAFVKSIESRYVSEGGIEDAIYRLASNRQILSQETLGVGQGTTTILITSSSTSRIIRSEGKREKFQQNLEAVLDVDSTDVRFFYGIQVGDLGIAMGNNSTIIGNIYSNGDIVGGGVGNTTVTGTAVSAGNHLLKDIRVDGDAYSDRFDNCSIGGTAHYVTSFTANCTAGSTVQDPTTQPPGTFPIPQSQIDLWKNEAASGGTLVGLNVPNNTSITLGPKKIEGTIDVGNNSTITVTGTIWVTGTIDFGNSATLKLDPATYGPYSGAVIVDGLINTGNTASLQGSGQTGSYFLLLSTFGPGDAIDIGNSATGTIFYAPNGIIDVGNSLELYQATARGLRTGNNTTIVYQSGLANLRFTSGPGAGWKLRHWKVVE